jgi:serine/threonine protein kinase
MSCQNLSLSKSDFETIQQLAPLLYALMNEVNQVYAAAWTLKLVKQGITDKHFPASTTLVEQTCKFYGLQISPLDVARFVRLQHSFFVRPVSGGQHVNYPDDSETPYKTLLALASGTFGKVEKVCLHADPKQVFARKTLLHVASNNRDRIAREIQLLKEFRHPHSIPFYGAYTHQQQVHLIFDLCDGNLREFFYRPPGWFQSLTSREKASKILNWMFDISTAIADFHALNGVHRDLKPENILIKGKRVYIADFGLATYGPSLSSNLASVHGTEIYMAPEQGRNEKHSRLVDIFAIGCIFLEFLVFGENISIKFFENFRRHYGSGQCEFSANLCYRHNLQAVSVFVSKYLRRKNPVTEGLIDIIEFDLMVAKPALRMSARDLRRKLLKFSNGWEFFRKDKCCNGDFGKVGYQNGSTKSLERMTEFLVTTDSESMELDIGEIAGALDSGFFGAL